MRLYGSEQEGPEETISFVASVCARQRPHEFSKGARCLCAVVHVVLTACMRGVLGAAADAPVGRIEGGVHYRTETARALAELVRPLPCTDTGHERDRLPWAFLLRSIPTQLYIHACTASYCCWACSFHGKKKRHAARLCNQYNAVQAWM